MSEKEMSRERLAMFYIAFCRLHKDEIKFKDGESVLDVKQMDVLERFFLKKNIPLIPYESDELINDKEWVRCHNQDVTG